VSTLAAGHGDRAGAGLALEAGRGGKPLSVIAQLGQQFRRQESAHAWQRGIDSLVQVLGKEGVESPLHLALGQDELPSPLV
jgi:hypothetical protein